ncbi:MAG: hypothetical protein LBM64_06835, partial [Deltaproteobacteria bacterium]|nr:hypothetical protein [Deltaproteobacteria bacterium]
MPAVDARDWMLNQADAIQKNYLESDIFSLPEELSGGLWNNPKYLLSARYWLNQARQAASSMGAMLLGAGAVGGGMKAAAAAGGIMEAGSFYNYLIKEGVDNDAALTASAYFGVITGLLNKVGLDK